MKRLFISGPITPKGARADTQHPAVEYIFNCRDMVEAANIAMIKGWAVYCPALDFLNFFLAGNKLPLDHIFPADIAWLEVSDAVAMVGDWESSGGAKNEHSRAEELGMKIYYGIEEVPDES